MVVDEPLQSRKSHTLKILIGYSARNIFTSYYNLAFLFPKTKNCKNNHSRVLLKHIFLFPITLSRRFLYQSHFQPRKIICSQYLYQETSFKPFPTIWTLNGSYPMRKIISEPPTPITIKKSEKYLLVSVSCTKVDHWSCHLEISPIPWPSSYDMASKWRRKYSVL